MKIPHDRVRRPANRNGISARQQRDLDYNESGEPHVTNANIIIMTAFRTVPGPSLHAGKHWAARQLSLEINRGHVLGLVLTVVLFLLVLNMISPPPADEAALDQEITIGATGFRGLPVTDELSLQDAARNHEYYRVMTSICHNRGKDRASDAYDYLFHANNRYSQHGRWSASMFDMAVDSVESYFDIDPVADCDPATGNFHGLDLDADLSLQTNALNHVFFNRKIGICRQAGNEVQARSYIFLADTELDKADNGRRTQAEINSAIRDARAAAEMQSIRGC
jgi:hypothetical protein